jgi:hypothetical protein
MPYPLTVPKVTGSFRMTLGIMAIVAQAFIDHAMTRAQKKLSA